MTPTCTCFVRVCFPLYNFTSAIPSPALHRRTAATSAPSFAINIMRAGVIVTAGTAVLLLFLIVAQSDLPASLSRHFRSPFPPTLHPGTSSSSSSSSFLDFFLPTAHTSSSSSSSPFSVDDFLSPSPYSLDLFHRQWDALMLHCRIWRGVWVRLDLSGNAYIWTYAMRNFTVINTTFVHQNNVYYNPLWRPAGSSPVWLLHKRTYYDPRTLGLGYHFYPQGWGLWSSSRLGGDVALAAMEKFFNVGTDRVSYTPFYRHGVLFRFSLVRERQDPRGVHADEVLPIKAQQVRAPGVRLSGVWVGVHECIDRQYVYTKRYAFYRDATVPLPIGPTRNALKHGWNISISVPTTAGLNGEVYETFFVWEVRQGTVVAGTTRYGADGEFEQDCSSMFTQLNM